jgi:Outer membrane cobalamin receptor protein
MTMVALVLLLGAASIQAQEKIEVRRVGADSLVSFIRKNISDKVYYVPEKEDVSSYTVSATRENFLKEAFRVFKEQGYTVSEYDGKYFILKGLGLATTLPAGYFDAGAAGDDDLSRYINSQNVMVTFQNKVYEIGDENTHRTGKVYVKGYVRDVASGEPIVGVSIYEEGTSVYAQTDGYGFYKLQIPVGDHVLGFSGYSLEDLKLNVKVYDDGGLDVVMKEKVFALKGAVISAESQMSHRSSKMGVEKVRISQIKNVPVAFGETDVLKVVLTLPGVKTVGEASTGFNVRGGSVDQNLILFNDGTIYNPSHMFGILSSFNADVINDIELYKSSIPAEFGGRISSVLDVRGREGNSKKVTGSLGLGVLTSRAHIEGPIVKDKTTFILGGRTTYSNWILNMLPENCGYAGGKAGFFDINAGISHKINENNSIHAYGYYSRDRFSFSSDTVFRYSNISGSLKWRSNFNERNSLTMSVGYDQFENNTDICEQDYNAYSLFTRIRQGYAKLNFKSILNDKHTLTYGLNAIMYDMTPGILKPYDERSLVEARSLAVEQAVEPALFVSETWQATDKLALEGGVRLSGFGTLGRKTNAYYGFPEIRLSGKYSFLDNLSLKAGFNSMRQYIHLLSNTASISPMDTWKLCDENIKPQDGWQAAAGLYWTLSEKSVDFSLETYYKRVINALDYKSGATLVMNENLADDLVTTRGKAYGVEFMVKKPLGKLNGWVSYTYSRSLLQETGDRGTAAINAGHWYCAPHDKPHDVKVVGNYKFTHRYSVSFNLDYSTGRPVTIPIGRYYYAGGSRLAFSERNGYRIPDYFRLDLAMNIEPSHYLKKLTHLSVTFGVYNVTGRKNAYSIFYTTDGSRDVSGYMLSVFASQVPYINLNLKF